MKLRQSCFPFSAMRCLEWRYWRTMGLFIMVTVTSSGRRWAGCWASRQRRSAAGRRPGKPWRNGRERPPSTLWYDYCNQLESTVHTVNSVLMSFYFFLPPSFFRKEALQTHRFLQKMSSLNLVSNENVWGVLCGWYQICIWFHELETIDVLILNKNIYDSHLATTNDIFRLLCLHVFYCR